MHARISTFLLLLLPLAGCGYQLSGRPGTVPAAFRQLSVPMFTNTTAVPGIERLFTAAVRERLLRDGRVQLATSTASTTVLRGEVTGYHVTVLAMNRDDRALEYRVQTDVRVSVEDLRQHQILLQQPLTTTTEYVISETLVPTDIARERALQAAARDVGERVVSLILDRF